MSVHLFYVVLSISNVFLCLSIVSLEAHHCHVLNPNYPPSNHAQNVKPQKMSSLVPPCKDLSCPCCQTFLPFQIASAFFFPMLDSRLNAIWSTKFDQLFTFVCYSRLRALGKPPWTRTTGSCTGEAWQTPHHTKTIETWSAISLGLSEESESPIPCCLWQYLHRSFIYLFDQLEKRKDDATFVIKASYLEIYNEKVRPSF